MRLDFDTKKLAKKIDYNTEQKIGVVVIHQTQSLIKQTPFDVGRAAANWHISQKRITSELYTLPEDDEGNKGAAITASIKRIEAWRGFKMNTPTCIVNNVAYMIPLEWGSSKQAPKGWIRNTANSLQKKLNEIKDIV